LIVGDRPGIGIRVAHGAAADAVQTYLGSAASSIAVTAVVVATCQVITSAAATSLRFRAGNRAPGGYEHAARAS
jgi:hypothetical protein